mmetsp:Transcript_26799/g.78649  ORF Transcript_26799/g.78649 Transcript_26799/m.78649 type:complete len:287 (+) Transcript_26799:71-931(+)
MISSHALPPRRPDAEPSARRETRPDRPRFYDAHMAEARAREPRTREYARSPPRPTSGERMHAPAWPKGRREKRVRAAVSLLHLPASIRLAAHRRRQRGTSKEHWQGNKPRARIARGGATAAGLGGVCFHATARGQAGTVGLDGAFHHAAGEGRGGHGGGGDVGRDGDGASELWQRKFLEVRHAKVWHELLPDPCCHPRRLWSEACLWRKPTRHRTACGSTPREDQHGSGQRERQSDGARDDTRTRRRGLKSDHWRRKRAGRQLSTPSRAPAPQRRGRRVALLLVYI